MRSLLTLYRYESVLRSDMLYDRVCNTDSLCVGLRSASPHSLPLYAQRKFWALFLWQRLTLSRK